jgi:large subunit ribosomal protein L25
MDKLTLTLEPRTVTGKKVKHLRAAGMVPASICGRGVTPVNYVTDARIFGRVYQQAGRNALIELQTPTGTLSAFIREIQRHPITTQWIHVDFRVVDLRTPMVADIPVFATGTNELVERGEAIANVILSTLHVRALPADLPQNIEVDISGITDFNTVLHVSDLNLGDKVEVLTSPEEALVTINPSTTAADEEEIVEQEEAGEPELTADNADTDPNAVTDDEAEQASE